MTPDRMHRVRMPAEWEPHEATWLAYPHHRNDWPGKLSAVRWAMVEFIRNIQQHETVHLLVRDAREAARALSAMRRGGVPSDAVKMHIRATNRSWLRDSGPTFVERDHRLGAVCWKFDGWGRYPDWELDSSVGRYIGESAGASVIVPKVRGSGVTMEGGAIDSNGLGTILATRQCLLGARRAGRNPGLTRGDYETLLRDAVGARHVLWLERGIRGDDTSGHVDTVARFIGPRTVVAMVERDRQDENYEPLRRNLERLRSMRDQDGRPLEIVEIPMPARLTFDGDRLPASYANFYITNGSVLVPTFNDPNDAVALRILESCLGGRQVCGIHSVEFVLGQGTLHCLAQQQPRTVLPGMTAESRSGDNGA